MPENHKLTKIDFWKIKHQIDDEVKRLGWSVDFCKRYTITHYNKRSRLVMSDEELLDLLDKLRNLPTRKIIQPMSNRRRKKRSR